MRMLLVVLLLTGSVWAQEIKSVTWLEADDGSWKGRVSLSAPAPAAGAKVIFEPTFHFQLPYSVTVPAGQTVVDFPLKLVDNTFLSGFTGLGEAGVGDMNDVTAWLNGKLWTGPGPQRR